ncbi:MAG TPA: TonB-dependent receptor [Steroidobacteraceae bacterium]|nr:TonB-dependent receptor [Steroidobacteraceae bacterium]
MLNATRTTTRLGTLLLTLLCTLLPLGAARADEAPAAAPAAAPSAPASSEAQGPLREIIVTATRREESLSKVPISVTALSQSDMDARGIKDMQDIVRFVPGVSIDTSGTNAISIRGISSSAGAGTTGIYIDDTPIQMRSLGFNPDDTLPKTFDLERVEVLRGPQGTLFGSGSEGGTVRYIMTQPSLTSTSSYLRSEVAGTWYGEPSYELGAAHGEPVVDGVFGWRASAWYRYDGGWVDRVDPTTGEKLTRNIDRASTLVLRLAAVWQPASGFTVTPSIIYQNHDKNDAGTYWPAYSDPSAGKFITATPERIPNPDEYFLPALKLQWDLAKSQIISNTSFYHRDEKTGYQGTVYDMAYYQSLGWPNNPNTLGLGCGPADQPAAGPAVTGPPCPWYPLLDANGLHLPAGFGNYQTPNVITNKQQSWVQEFRWQSSDPNERLHWTVGLFGQVAKESSIEELIDTQIDPFFNALYGINATDLFGYTDQNGNFVSPYQCNGFGSYTAIPQCDIYYNSNTTWDKQIAFYGELNYALSEHWRLTLGERVAHTTFEIQNYADGLENFGPTPVNGVSTPGVGRSASTSSNPNTPKASLAFQLDPSNMFYASYAKGFRVGGGNPELPSYCATDLATAGYPNGAPLLYSPDTTQNYEIGAKNVIGGVLRLATSVYYIDWSNIQQSVYVAGACGLQFTTNLGTAVSKGFDLQAQLALGQLFVDFAVGYNDARFTKDSLPPAGSPPLVSKGDAISGQAAIDYAPGTNPPWEIAIGPEYRFNIAQHEAFVRLDYTYESKNPWLAAVQDPRTSQFIPASYSYPATSFLSLRAGVNVGEWQISPFIDNVLNSHTVTNYALGQTDPYNPNGSPSQQQNAYTFRPFTVGVTATWRVGGGGH